MRRLKEDLGITLERTGEWDCWIDNEDDHTIHFKMKNPPKNKFIDLDTFVIYCELKHEHDETPDYRVRFKLLFSGLNGGERFLYQINDHSVGGGFNNDRINAVGAYGIWVSLNDNPENENSYEILIADFEEEQLQILENVHIYYAYTTLKELVNIQM